jgi:hypothetical protein
MTTLTAVKTLKERHNEQQPGEVINYRISKRSREIKSPETVERKTARRFVMGCDNINGLYNLFESKEKELKRPPTQFEYMREYSIKWMEYLQKPGRKHTQSKYWGNESLEEWDKLTKLHQVEIKNIIRERAVNAWAGKMIEHQAVADLQKLEAVAGYKIKKATSNEFLDRVLGADILLIVENSKGVDVLLYIGITSEEARKDAHKNKKNTIKQAKDFKTGEKITFERDTATASRLFLTYSSEEIKEIPFQEVGKLPTIKAKEIKEIIGEKMRESEQHPERFETVGRSPNLEACREFYKRTGKGKTLNR